MASLRIGAWNANGLAPVKNELKVMLEVNKIDIMLISETHLNDRKVFILENYNVYHTNHPDGTCHGGTAILIKQNIKHNIHSQVREDYLQATTITVQNREGPVNVSAVYCPPRFTIKEDTFKKYFEGLGNRYICGGDWNSKHTHWGSRLITTRGRELKKCLDTLRLTTLSTGEPTYWPTDRNKLPDLLDFFIVKGFSDNYLDVESCLDTASDHTPIVGTFSITIIHREPQSTLYNHKTDWTSFAEYLEKNTYLGIKLKTETDIDEATFYITNLIQEAGWRSTPYMTTTSKTTNISLQIRGKLAEKRRLRRVWQLSRHPEDRRLFNKSARELKAMINENENHTFQQKLTTLSASKSDNYTLWKITKTFSNRPQQQVPPLKSNLGTWAKSSMDKAELFAQHLSKVFKPNACTTSDFEHEVNSIIGSDQQLSLPIKLVTPRELWRCVRSLGNKKTPGFDLITGEILKQLPKKPIVFLTMLFNAIMRVHYYPKLWKLSQMCMLPKPGKVPTEPSSYRPISLLPAISKLFEKIFLSRLKPILEKEAVIPNHQFGFRTQHSTIEQVHRVVNKIRQSLEQKEYCAAVFLDIQQAFDRVWHEGLLYKLKLVLPNSYYMVLKSYLVGRKFQVKFGDEVSRLYDIEASVPQGSVLGPVLYSIYTADLPVSDNVVTATYADDTACLVSHNDPAVAAETLQIHLYKVEEWFEKWRIKPSVSKSLQITFTLRRGDCPAVTLRGEHLPQEKCVKYLGFHLDRRLTWASHIKAKRKEADLNFKRLYWLIGRLSPLSLTNKLLVYKCIIKPIWTYGIQLWGSASNSNLDILQRFQNNILRTVSNAPWFAKNSELHEYLNMPTIKEEVNKYATKYKERLQTHTNQLARDLVTNNDISRLKRWQILQLDSRH
jgi:hypothetical protein